MNDGHRIAAGIFGTAVGWTISNTSEAASILASLATAAFMGVSIWLKLRKRK
ncbi:MAG: hypothetical protein PHE83_09445 [Opitutaceae bacterium]|nr:hypothetical protein [Opitutaceae bacterium]